MGGQQSAGFDLVMEFSEKPLQDVLGVAFDTSNFLCDLLSVLNLPCQGFTLSVSLDRPTDVPLTADQTNAVDIQISGALGPAWRIRLVAGIDVDRSRPGFQTARLNLQDRLYFRSATLAGVPVNTDALANRLRNIPLLISVPVATEPGAPLIMPTQLDVKVIDVPVGENVFAVCLTFGGGTPGNVANLTASVVNAGDNATRMPSFGWRMRLLAPATETGLGVAPDDFVDGHLVRRAEIDKDHDVFLTQLDFDLVDEAVRLRARVEKNGFCYTASATFGGDFTINVENGKLHVDAVLSDPDFDIDVPWYCWIGAGFLGALLGGLIGAVVLPLLLHLITSTVEDVVNTVADTVVSAINSAVPTIDVPAVGFDLIFQRAFIDDVAIGCRVVVRDTAPVRCQGTVRLRPGQVLDLDNGKFGAPGPGIDGADLRWVGKDTAAKLEALCISRIADTPWIRFDEVPRYRLYGLGYTERSIPVADLGRLIVTDLPFGPDIEMFFPSMAVYAVLTNERRISLIQVTGIDDDVVTLRYKTYGLADPTVRILGAYSCPPRTVRDVVLDGKVAVDSVFTRAPVAPRAELPAKLTPLLARASTVNRRAASTRPVTPPVDIERLEEMTTLEDTLGGTSDVQLRSGDAVVNLRASELLAVANTALPAMSLSIPRTFAVLTVPRQRTTVFTAIADRISEVRTVTWWINGILLDPAATHTGIDGVNYDYSQQGSHLTLTTDSKVAYEFELRVAVENANADRYQTSRCVPFDPVCPRQYPVLTSWREQIGVVKGYPTTVLS